MAIPRMKGKDRLSRCNQCRSNRFSLITLEYFTIKGKRGKPALFFAEIIG